MWDVLTEIIGKHQYSGGSAGITPIVMQAATKVAYESVRVESKSGSMSEEIANRRERAKQALDLIIAAHQRLDLPDGDRTWTDQGLKTFQNHVYSAIEEIESENKKYDKAYLLERKKLIDSVVGVKVK